MNVKIELVNLKIYEEELDGLLDRLPEWRLVEALSYRYEHDQYRCAESFLLLQRLINEEYGLEDIPKFFYEENGKPYFREYPQIHFNISHCRTGIACAVDDKPIGIDIEDSAYHEEIAKFILSAQEFAIVQSSACPAQEFLKFWTMKESYLKFTGEGIAGGDLKYVLSNLADGVQFKTYFDKSFVTTVAFSEVVK